MTRLRLATAMALGTMALLLVTGCSRPPGIDGSLVDEWAPPPATEVWQPAANTCHLGGFVDKPTLAGYEPVDCGDQHLLETVHVGSFPERPTPPPVGSPERRTAYAECLTRSAEFLGEDWRSGRLWLGLAVPSSSAWSGGARWYRCDLWEIKDKEDPEDVPRSGSLKDALRGTRPLAFSCYQATIKNDEVDAMVTTDCAKPHNAEFAGVYVAPDVNYPKTDKERDDLAFDGCRATVAKFANVPNDGNFYRRTGLIATSFSEEEWTQGNRGFLCHLWLDKNASRSMRGAGPSVLPAG